MAFTPVAGLRALLRLLDTRRLAGLESGFRSPDGTPASCRDRLAGEQIAWAPLVTFIPLHLHAVGAGLAGFVANGSGIRRIDGRRIVDIEQCLCSRIVEFDVREVLGKRILFDNDGGYRKGDRSVTKEAAAAESTAGHEIPFCGLEATV
jgi:hypothetical protein